MSLLGSARSLLRRSRFRGYGLSFTPAGAGVAFLLLPGLVIAVRAQNRLLIAVSIGAGLLLVINAVLAAIAAGRISVRLDGPDLAQTGEPIDVRVLVDGDLGVLCEVQVAGGYDWAPTTVPADGPVSVEFRERSWVDEVAVTIRTSFPLDLIMLTRSISVSLGSPIIVAPTVVPTQIAAVPPSTARLGPEPDDDVAGLRTYRPGDLKRDVHWPSVARTRTLIVRDRRPSPSPHPPALRITARRPAGVERAIGRARSAGEQLLSAGHQIRLDPSPPSATDGSGTPSVIGSPRELARRLASLDPAGVLDRGRPATRTGPTLQIDEKEARWQVCD